jgi:hypothetical protein
MHRSTSVVVFALGFALTAACGDDDGGGESLAALCQRACALASSVGCPNDDASTCTSDCEGADAFPQACQSPARDALECAVSRPVSDWECDAQGTAVLNDICGEEGNAFLVCRIGEDGMCPFENDGECDDPTGTAICPAETDRADCTM